MAVLPVLLLHREQLASMPNYSRTLPSGTTVGKFWRRDRKVLEHRAPAEWAVCCYAEHADPRLVRVLEFEVVLLEGPVSPEWQAPDWHNTAQYDGPWMFPKHITADGRGVW